MIFKPFIPFTMRCTVVDLTNPLILNFLSWMLASFEIGANKKMLLQLLHSIKIEHPVYIGIWTWIASSPQLFNLMCVAWDPDTTPPMANRGGIVHNLFQAEAPREIKAQVETEGNQALQRSEPLYQSAFFPSLCCWPAHQPLHAWHW